MSPYSWVSLDPDEEILIHDHPSKWILADEIIMGVALIGVALIVALREPVPLESLSVAGIPGKIVLVSSAVVVALATIGIASLARVKTVYLITTKQIYWKKGILSYHGDPIDIPDVVDQEAKKNIVEKQLGFGTVTIKTAATAELEGDNGDVGHLKFRHIPDPIGVKKELRRAKQQYRRHAKEEEIRQEMEIRQQEGIDQQTESQRSQETTVSTGIESETEGRQSSQETESLW